MKKTCFSILVGLLVSAAASAQSREPTPEDLREMREMAPFRDFLISLIQQGKLPEVKTNEHGSLNCFRVNGERREAWLTKKMQKEVKGCGDAFLATLEIAATHRHLQYLYCKEGNSFRLISLHKEKTGPWPKKIIPYQPTGPPKKENAQRNSLGIGQMALLATRMNNAQAAPGPGLSA